jgi:hypothetical protein
MVRNKLLTPLLASSAVILAVATAAHAESKNDRAHEAVAAADAKIHTAESLGAGVETPASTAAAREALAMAREDLASGHTSESIADAIHASALADTVIGEAQRHKNDALAAARAAQQESATAAQDQEAAARDQVTAAQQEAASAREEAAQANSRADAAQQAAASSAADAAEARGVAAAAQAQTAQVETTVTTRHRGSAHRSTRAHVIRHTAPVAPASTDDVTTSTSVTQH